MVCDVDQYAFARKLHFLTSDFQPYVVFGLTLVLTSDLLTSKSNQSMPAPYCT